MPEFGDEVNHVPTTFAGMLSDRDLEAFVAELYDPGKPEVPNKEKNTEFGKTARTGRLARRES